MELKAYAAKTNEGPFLKINEDDYDVDFVNQLYMIFDGFGGSGIGDKTVKDLKNNIKNFYTKVCDDPDATMPFFFSPRYLIEGNALVNAVSYSHKTLFKDNDQKNLSSRGGSSVMIASGAENILNILGVGNCRAYLLRKGKLEKLIDDDSIRFLSEDSNSSIFKTAPQNALGLFEDYQSSFKEVRIADKDIIVFITDGIYSRVNDHEIESVINTNINDLNQAVENLFETANKRGNLDNQTALMLQF